MDTLTDADLGPLTLPYWPICRKALTWSTENLAVAAGEVVHVLTPDTTLQPHEVRGLSRWHTSTVRVNQFEPDEWPLQNLATISQFSLGEELSESIVVSISWSSPGLGLHKRSVLAVLTSNLILSIWETNGKPGLWQRTGIVNPHLATVPDREDFMRQRIRVRAFTWLPSLPNPSAVRTWGRHILAVADDDYTVSFFEVKKSADAALGHWAFMFLTQYRFADLEQPSPKVANRQTLRANLTSSAPISALETGAWQSEQTSATLCIRVGFGQCGESRSLLVHVRFTTTQPAQEDHDFALSVTSSTTCSDHALLSPPPGELFESVVSNARSKFDHEHGLGGRVRVSQWGTAWSPGQTAAVTCVSLHPSNMIEHGMPPQQHILVLFVRTEERPLFENVVENPFKVQERIFESMVDTSEGLVLRESDFSVLRNAAAIMKLNFHFSNEMINSVDSWMKQYRETGSGDSADQQQEETEEYVAVEKQQNTAEVCALCDLPIPFASDLRRARCTSGHLLTRCSLSFVAIQEPGISKYCSKCGRQFLDPGKMKFPDDGPSFIRLLFDKFDVCPYCQAKFRG